MNTVTLNEYRALIMQAERSAVRAALSLSDEVAVLAGDWARWLAAHVAGRTYRAIILTPTEIDSLDRAGLLRDGSRRSPEPIPCALINGARFSTFPTPPVEEWAELVSPRS